jgi:hypothetical protein
MGLFSSSQTTKTNEQFETGPGKFQLPYLQSAFDAAQSNFNQQNGTPYYQGDTYAGMTDEAKSALSRLKDYASTYGLGSAQTLSSLGTSLAGNFSKAGDMLGQYTAMANEDPTQANINAAMSYADTPYLQGQIDAASRDVSRNLMENELPSIDRAASATGNINSSRAGVASGIAQRGAGDRIADISAAMRGNAYSQGLSMAQSDRASRMSALGSAATAYGNLGSSGIDALGRGTDAGYAAYGAISGADQAEQADRQGGLDADFAKWQGEDSRTSELLNRYYGIVGSNSWGQQGTSSGTSKTKSKNSIMGTLAGMAATAGSMYTGMPA